jgi:hypothetical protein
VAFWRTTTATQSAKPTRSSTADSREQKETTMLTESSKENSRKNAQSMRNQFSMHELTHNGLFNPMTSLVYAPGSSMNSRRGGFTPKRASIRPPELYFESNPNNAPVDVEDNQPMEDKNIQTLPERKNKHIQAHSKTVSTKAVEMNTEEEEQPLPLPSVMSKPKFQQSKAAVVVTEKSERSIQTTPEKISKAIQFEDFQPPSTNVAPKTFDTTQGPPTHVVASVRHPHAVNSSSAGPLSNFHLANVTSKSSHTVFSLSFFLHIPLDPFLFVSIRLPLLQTGTRS